MQFFSQRARQRPLSDATTSAINTRGWNKTRWSRGREFCNRASVDRLQLFPRLKPYSSSWRNGHLGPRTRIAPNPGLPWPHIEHAKSSQFNAIAGGQCFLHAFEDRFHGQLGFGLGDAGLGHHFIDNVELDHKGLPVRASKMLLQVIDAKEDK